MINKASLRAIKSLRRRILSNSTSKSTGAMYYRRLKHILSVIDNSYINNLDLLLNGKFVDTVIINKLDKELNIILNVLIEKSISEFLHSTEQKVNRTLNTFPVFDIDIYKGNQELSKALTLAADENGNLITSLAQSEIARVKEIVYNTVRAGATLKQAVSSIRAEGVPQKRAKFIAYDQLSKVEGSIRRARQIDAGFSYFKWATLKDYKVRKSHDELSKAKTPYGIGVYRWDDLPKIDGRPVYPGSDYHCRCIALPIMDDEIESKE